MIIIIKDGYDVIDNRPVAEIAQSERDYFEERYNRDLKRKKAKQEVEQQIQELQAKLKQM